MRRLLISSVALALAAGGAPAVAQVADSVAPTTAGQVAESEDARLAAFFDQAFQEAIALSPQSMTALGMKTDYDKLDQNNDAAAARSLALSEAQLARMKAGFDYDALSPQSQLSWRLFEHGVVQDRLSNQWRKWGFQFAANGNPTTGLPVFMINNHRVDTVEDAEAYVARLIDAERAMGDVAAELRDRAARGVISPIFVFEPSKAAWR